MVADRRSAGAAGGDVKTLRKSLELLEALARTQPVGVVELARELGIPKSRASRFLNTLAEAGYAERLSDGRLVLGPKVLELTGAAQVARLMAKAIKK